MIKAKFGDVQLVGPEMVIRAEWQTLTYAVYENLEFTEDEWDEFLTETGRLVKQFKNDVKVKDGEKKDDDIDDEKADDIIELLTKIIDKLEED